MPIASLSGKVDRNSSGYHYTTADGVNHFRLRDESYQQRYSPRRQYDRAAFAAANALRSSKAPEAADKSFGELKNEWKAAHPFERWLAENHLSAEAETPRSAASAVRTARFSSAPDAEPSDEYRRMVSGELYQADDPSLLYDLNVCKDLCWQYNNTRPTDIAARSALLQQILGQSDEDTFINQPFYCDYGQHIRVGKRFFANFNFVVLDEALVTIGDDCFVGPNVSIYTACHSTDPVERNSRKEWALPVTIGDNCWIGGSVTILAGVTVGEGSTIGAGSVVTHDIPAHSVAVGNPARVIRSLA